MLALAACNDPAQRGSEDDVDAGSVASDANRALDAEVDTRVDAETDAATDATSDDATQEDAEPDAATPDDVDILPDGWDLDVLNDGRDTDRDARPIDAGLDGSKDDDVEEEDTTPDIEEDVPDDAGCEIGADFRTAGSAASALHVVTRCENECVTRSCRDACLERHVSTVCSSCVSVLLECARDECRACGSVDSLCWQTCAYTSCGERFEQCAFPTADPTLASETAANVRLLNLTADATLDIYVEGTTFRAAEALAPSEIETLLLPPDHHGFEVRLAGAAVDSDPLAVILPGPFGFGSGKQVIVSVWGAAGQGDEPIQGGFMYEDESSISTTRIRMVNVMTVESLIDIWNVFDDETFLRAGAAFASFSGDTAPPPTRYQIALEFDERQDGFDATFEPFELTPGRQATFWFANTADGEPYLMLTYLHGGADVFEMLP